MGWTIKGDGDVTVTTVAGVTYGLDATERTFAEMKMAGWTLKFQSLADDTFSYTVRTQNAKGKGTIVPRDGQEIHVYYDGIRKFKGHVIKPKLGLKSLSVTAVGPWWWLGKIHLSGSFGDSTGGDSDRNRYAFPTQGLSKSFRSLIHRAVEMGVPMADMTTDGQEEARISGMFEFIKTTLSHMSFAAAFAELMGYVADAVMWFDYSETPPELHITRRADMETIDYTVGGEGAVRVESAEIFPRTDQVVRRVDLKFMKRQAVTGYPQWGTQTTGEALTTQTHKRQVQIVTISGPETVAFFPKADYESIKVATLPWASITKDYIVAKDSALAAIKKQYGSVPGGATTGYYWYTGFSTAKIRMFTKFAGLRLKSVTGKALKKNQRHLVISTDPLPEWAVKQLGAVEVEITGTWGAEWTSSGPWSAAYNAVKAGAFHWHANFWDNDLNYGGSQPPGGWGTADHRSDFAARSFTVRGWVLKAPHATLEKVYKDMTYDFIQPPEGLSDALKNTQDWTPWEGPVTLARQDLTGYNGLRRKFNLLNSHPDHNGMNALVKAVTYDGARHRVIWDLGPPARTDLGGLVNKLRRSPQDNIKWL